MELLDYSRMSAAGHSPRTIDMEAVFDEAVSNLAAAIEESGAEITHDPLPTVAADGTQMMRLMQNLLANAVHYRGARQPRIHVSATRRETEWIVSVKDNGIGIGPEHAERIFEIFRRLHTETAYEGTGIGLATCQRIVEQHGGRIWVESDVDVGSTFSFSLPDRNPASLS